MIYGFFNFSVIARVRKWNDLDVMLNQNNANYRILPFDATIEVLCRWYHNEWIIGSGVTQRLPLPWTINR